MPNTLQHEACRQGTLQRVGVDIDRKTSALPPSVQPILVPFSIPFGTCLVHESEDVPLIPGLAIHMRAALTRAALTAAALTAAARHVSGGHGNSEEVCKSEKGSAREALWEQDRAQKIASLPCYARLWGSDDWNGDMKTQWKSWDVLSRLTTSTEASWGRGSKLKTTDCMNTDHFGYWINLIGLDQSRCKFQPSDR